MLNHLTGNQNFKLGGNLLFTTKIKNFPLQIIGLISLNSKFKANNLSQKEDNCEVWFEFLSEVLNRETNRRSSKSISYKLTCDLILLFGINLKEKTEKIRNHIEDCSKGFDPSFFLYFPFSSLKLFFLKITFPKKLGKKLKNGKNFEEISGCFFSSEEIVNFLTEIGQSWKLIDLGGISLSGDYHRNHGNIIFSGKKKIWKIFFLISQKAKDYGNLIKISKSLNDLNMLFVSIEEPFYFSDQACLMISLEKRDIISIFGSKSRSKDLSKFMKALMKNFINFKTTTDNSLGKVFDLNFTGEEPFSKTNFQKKKKEDFGINPPFLIGNSGFSKFFSLEDELNNFREFFFYIDQISIHFSRKEIISGKTFFQFSFLKDFSNKTFSFVSENDNYAAFFDQVFPFDFLKGLGIIKHQIEGLVRSFSQKFLETKLFPWVISMGFYIYSERLFAFFLKNLKIKYISTFLETKDIALKKNLEHLILGGGVLFAGSDKICSRNQFYSFEAFFKTFWILSRNEMKKGQKHYDFGIKKRLDLYSLNGITGLLMFSLSLLHLTFFQKKTIAFTRELINFFGFFGDNFFWDFEKKCFQIYAFISLGMLVFKKRQMSFFITIYLSLIRNKRVRLILRFFVQLCSHIGTSDLRLISLILKDLENYNLQKNKRLQRLHLIQNKKRKKKDLPKEKVLAPISDHEEKKTFFFSRLKIKMGILGLAVLAFNDGDTIQMIFQIFSYFFSNNDLEYSRISILTFGLFFLSRPESSSVDFLIRLTGSKDWRTVKNSIFSLGLIGAGTHNSRILSALKYLSKFYLSKMEFSKMNKRFIPRKKSFFFGLKIKSILSVLRISQGLISSTENFLTVSQFWKKEILDSVRLTSLLCVLQGISDSGFVGIESIPFSIFFLIFLFQSKKICSLDKDLKIKSILIKEKILNSSKEKSILTPFQLDLSNANTTHMLSFFSLN